MATESKASGGMVLAAFLFIPVSIVWRAYVFKTLWWWFVVPAFGLPGLTLTQVYGLSLLVSLMQNPPTTPKSVDDKKLVEEMLKAILIPAMVLLEAWITTLFM